MGRYTHFVSHLTRIVLKVNNIVLLAEYMEHQLSLFISCVPQLCTHTARFDFGMHIYGIYLPGLSACGIYRKFLSISLA